MPRTKLHEVRLPTDRWSARAVSPLNIARGIEPEKYGPVVILHPGWGKSPERHARFLIALADSGFLPIGVDTRFAYSDRRIPRANLLTQSLRVGAENPFFEDSSRVENRTTNRRPTVLLDMCERLGITKRSYIGHSEGTRVVSLATLAAPELTDRMVLVNGAGMGDSSHGVHRLASSNADRIGEMVISDERISELAKSALGSVAYAAIHPRRTLMEKAVIQRTNTWEILDELEPKEVDVSVFHAVDDRLVSYADCASNASVRPWISFTPTPGSHSNIYEIPVQKLIINQLHGEI